MIVNGISLLQEAPIKDMLMHKCQEHGVSHGLSEVGYDLRVREELHWTPPNPINFFRIMNAGNAIEDREEKALRAFHGFTRVNDKVTIGRTALASSIEEFEIPQGLWCEFRNKSTFARSFVDGSLGTDGEPGWKGWLTIEVIFHGLDPVVIPAGSGLLKAVFHRIEQPAQYNGKYQNQPTRPVEAIFEKG